MTTKILSMLLLSISCTQNIYAQAVSQKTLAAQRPASAIKIERCAR